MDDTLNILGYLMERNLLLSDAVLHSIASGVTAESSVNVDSFNKLG